MAADDRTPPAEVASCARAAGTDRALAVPPAEALAGVLATARWADWLPLHAGWVQEPPAVLGPDSRFTQQVKIMGIPGEVDWQVAALDDTGVVLAGSSRLGVSMTLVVRVRPGEDASQLHLDLGLDGDSVQGPMGATVQRAAQQAVDDAATALAAVLEGEAAGAGPASGTVRHHRTGVDLDPTTPVIVGVGQVVQREPSGELLDPAALSVQALRRAADDAGGTTDLLADADAVFAVASASWTYADQAALVAGAVGATPRETVVSAPFGGDGGQLVVNAAAAAIAAGEAGIVIVSGAEAGATLAAAQKRGVSPDWPVQPADVRPTRVLGVDREANNEAESAAGLGRPIHMYALIESAVRGAAGATPEEHDATITELWSRFSDVAADNPYAWRPQHHDAAELAAVTPDNRMISTPYRKLLCANLQVDLAAGLILCSAAVAAAAGIDQDRWVFVHAGASGSDEWYVSERADLAASPAIAGLGAAVLDHAGIGIDDVEHVDLYACFPSAVEIGAAALGLPIDDPARPLTVTGGLTFGGGPGNNYGAHAVANLVGRLRAEPDTYGLATSLGWFLTKHAIGVYSATPPRRPYADLHPVLDLPPARPAPTSYRGPAVVEACTVAYDRAGRPATAVVATITPDGARMLVQLTEAEAIAALQDGDPLRRAVEVDGPRSLRLGGPERLPLPAPPPSPVLVERRGPITVITLNRPEVRNAIDPRTALLLERALDGFEADDTARVAVLTGANGYFCAGMDLKAAARGEFPFSERRGPLGITERPPVKPLIAAVEGSAVAGGCELALSADLVVASSTAQFGLPEPKRGLVAAAGGVLRLAQRLPRAIALEFVLTGEPVPAARCAELGLVNRVVEPGGAVDAAVALAEVIAANAPMSVALSKRIVDESPDWTRDEAFARQTELATPALVSHDAGEGIRAFAEHREPVWTGR